MAAVASPSAAAPDVRPHRFTVFSNRGVDGTGPSGLPVELLVEIFRLALQSRRLIWHPNGALPLEFRLVCRRWADVVDGAPILWTLIGDAVGDALMALALRKSARSTLTVRLSLSTTHTAYRLLQKHSSRLQAIEAAQCGQDMILGLRELHLPRLQRIRAVDLGYLPTVLNAPNLFHVTCESVSRVGPLRLSGLKSLSLVDCKLVEISLEDLWLMLEQSPELVQLHLERTRLSRSPWNKAVTLWAGHCELKLPKLRRFVCYDTVPQELGTLLMCSIRPSFVGPFAISVPGGLGGIAADAMAQLAPHLTKLLCGTAERSVNVQLHWAWRRGPGYRVAIHSKEPFHHAGSIGPHAFGIDAHFSTPCSPTDIASILAPIASVFPRDFLTYFTSEATSTFDHAPIKSLFPNVHHTLSTKNLFAPSEDSNSEDESQQNDEVDDA